MTERILDYLLLGLTSIRNYKLRSVLTTLGVVFGIAALLSMLAVGEGARRQILDEMDRMGLRNIIVTSRRPELKPSEDETSSRRGPIYSFGLTFEDLARCRETIPGLVRALPLMEVYWPTTIRGDRANARVLAVTPDYFKTFPAVIERGRNLCDLDSVMQRQVCVLATPLPPASFLGRDPLEVSVSVGEHLLKVVGVITPRAEVFAGSHENRARWKGGAARSNLVRVYLPYETAVSRYGTRRYRREQGTRERFNLELDQIVLECREPLLALRPLKALLAKGHKDVDYEITVPVELLHQRQRTQDIFNIVMVLVAGLTLLVGGIGIVNIMLVSVAERTKEIGIRRALGARRRDIMLQFLVETVALTLTGGLIGVLTGFAGVLSIALYTGWPVQVTPWAVAGSLLVAVAAGVFFGLYPARRAASVSPAVALRYE